MDGMVLIISPSLMSKKRLAKVSTGGHTKDLDRRQGPVGAVAGAVLDRCDDIHSADHPTEHCVLPV